MQHLQPNTTLQGGKYRIDNVLGQGGFGNTYVGYNTEFDERIAIKEFFLKGVTERDETTSGVSVVSSDEDTRRTFQEQKEKFKKEARRLRRLSNEHIVRVHDLFEENGTAYYVMDYINGENLSERLKRTNMPLTEQEVWDILPQVLDALDAAHANGLLHLDIKPGNIMIDKNGNVKIIDFGASKQLDDTGRALTGTAVARTPGYAPREQMEQSYNKIGPWTDIYALGATLYALVTNRRPPMPSDIDDDDSEDKHEALPLPNGISIRLRNLIIKMMDTNRNRRPQSVEEVRLLMENQKFSVDNDSKISSNQSVDAEETTIFEHHNQNNRKERNANDNNEETIVSSAVFIKNNSNTTIKDDSNNIIYLLIGSFIFALIAVLFFKGCGSGSNYSSSSDDYYAVDSDSVVIDDDWYYAVDTVACDTAVAW